MQEIKRYIVESLPSQNFDSIACGAIDFKSGKIETAEFYEGEVSSEEHYFDIASLTKPFTLSLSYLINSDVFDDDMKLLLNHRAGLPSYGRLSKKYWREFLKSFSINESEVLYSDYSALRLMIELEKKLGVDLKSFVQPEWDTEVLFHKDLSSPKSSPSYGKREGTEIRGVAHDPNAYTLDEFCSHAGLFSTVTGVLKSLQNFNDKLQMIKRMREELSSKPRHRFVLGFDTVTDVNETLAGSGHSENTFGHLGFSGSSFWIDTEKEKGHCILTNATQNFWYQRQGLRKLRRDLGSRLIRYAF